MGMEGELESGRRGSTVTITGNNSQYPVVLLSQRIALTKPQS